MRTLATLAAALLLGGCAAIDAEYFDAKASPHYRWVYEMNYDTGQYEYTRQVDEKCAGYWGALLLEDMKDHPRTQDTVKEFKARHAIDVYENCYTRPYVPMRQPDLVIEIR